MAFALLLTVWAMACAAITSNRSALFLFVKIHIFSFGRCTHRGMGYEPLVMCRSSFSSQSSSPAQFTAMTRASYFSLNLLHAASCSILPRFTQNCFSQRTRSRTHFLNLLFFTGTLTVWAMACAAITRNH